MRLPQPDPGLCENPSTLTQRQHRFRIRWNTKYDAGDYSPLLPDPSERRRIRQAAGLTQQDVADELGVSQDSVYRWEKPGDYGYDDTDDRLPGREPTGKLRREYAALLDKMERLKTRFYDQ